MQQKYIIERRKIIKQMALTDQPYLPLYVDDWMNNNKLKMCSPSAHGLMISIMCIMHKEENYGTILLKQKFKQTNNQVKDFALQVAKLCAFDFAEIEQPFIELLDEKVLKINGDTLVCPRMIEDAELSRKRAKSGRSGGKKTQSKNKDNKAKGQASDETFALAKDEANTVNGIVIENVNEDGEEKKGTERKAKIAPQKVIDLFHQFCPNLSKVQVLNKSRKSVINARIKEHGLGTVTKVFQMAGESTFLNGQNKEEWAATFDWIMKPTNFAKVLEGNYRNKTKRSNQANFVSNR